jgi:diguanylate cyclase (GGDEF)-like protein
LVAAPPVGPLSRNLRDVALQGSGSGAENSWGEVRLLEAALRERLEKCASLPSLPSVAVRVLQLCQRDDLDLAEIARVVAHDPALAAKVLKMVNSPAFGVRQEVRTLSHAVALLGANAVRMLVLSFSLARDMGRTQKAGLKTFWKRSVLSAVAAREALGEAVIAQREEAFVAALLQDIGVLALQRALGREYEVMTIAAGDDHERLASIEREQLGCDHAEVGGWLLTKWKLPERLCVAVLHSHEPKRLEPRSSEDVGGLVNAVGVSGRIADIWVGADPGIATNRARRDAVTMLPGGESAFEPTCGRILAAVPQLAELFEIELDADAMAGVLEQAQEALMMASLMASRAATGAEQALRELETKAQQFKEDSERDGLTGVANRRRSDAFLRETFTTTGRHSRVSVLLVDLDHFKTINDTYGHPAGDLVLRSVGQCLQDSLRDRDFVGRWGGEEFIIVLPGAPAQAARSVAERIRIRVAGLAPVLPDGRRPPITISIGCATTSGAEEQTIEALCEAADKALYAAKRAGRNRVVASGPEAPADAA